MHWSNFHFACRYAKQTLTPERSLQEVLKQFNTDYPQKAVSLHSDIFSEISQKSSIDEQIFLLDVYGKLDFSHQSNLRNKYLLLRLYLLLLFSLYTLFSLVVYIFVIPPLLEMLNGAVGGESVFSIAHFGVWWFCFTALVVGCMLWNLLFHQQLSKLHDIELLSHKRMPKSWLIPRKIKALRMKMTAIALAPFKKDINPHSANANAYLAQLVKDKLALDSELQIAYNETQNAFDKSVAKKSQQIAFVTGLFVVLAIFNLLATVYAPIFSSGGMFI